MQAEPAQDYSCDFKLTQYRGCPPVYPARRYLARESSPPVPSNPTTPRKLSQAASFNDGSELTRSRIISQAAILSAPSGGIPMASDTAHCGQKQILCAPDFCRGRTPTVCANMYTATDLSPASISRLQRKQEMDCTGILPGSLV